MTNRLIGNNRIIFPGEQLESDYKNQGIGKLSIEIMKKVDDNSLNAFVHDFNIYLPICNFQKNLSLFKDISLAIDSIRPIYVDVIFFRVNEQYGTGENTIVRKEETIVKEIFFSLDSEKYDFKSFIERIVMPLDKIKAREIVVNRYNDNQIVKVREKKSSYDHYNDNLDLDQQSPEFWDSL